MYEKIDLSDTYNLSIILQRCAGVYGAIAKIWPIEHKEMKEKTFNQSMEILTLATMAMAQKRGRPLEDKAVNKQVSEAFSVYVDIYYASMEKNQISTGSIFSDLVKSDLEICKALSQ